MTPAKSKALGDLPSYRPAIRGTRHMVVTEHYAASHVAFSVLEAGGNAIDAGCAAGIALGVLKPDLVSAAGVAPIIIYEKKSDTVFTVAGLGHWPKLTDPRVFIEEFKGRIPPGILRTVVPAAPDAWITALARFGTLTFGEAARSAIRFASEGFPVYPFFCEVLSLFGEDYKRWPSSQALYLPNGRVPQVGEIFQSKDLARSLQYMVDEEGAAAKKGRLAGLQASRDAFYRGDLAASFVDYHLSSGGWLRHDDLANFHAEIERATTVDWHGISVFAGGPWCQGPVLLQILNLIDPNTLKGLGHNSAAYVHLLIEAIKLGFSDREKYYGDPRYVTVPLEYLLSKAYSDERRLLIDSERAWPGMPPPGEPPQGTSGSPPVAKDTTYICVVDQEGNIFSSSPSDTTFDGPIIPGTGLCLSTRGSQSWAQPDHPSAVAPGKRPRLTPAPALAIKKGEWAMPFGTPGGDIQQQVMLQVFLNVAVWGMDPQSAVEAPRFASYSFPDSFEPHDYFPRRVQAEGRIPGEVRASLQALGHDVVDWPDWSWRAGAVCAILEDVRSGILVGGADPRRPAYALGW
jgi:gamma-glutamyltranspeptidase/glutathione hydrolase